MHAHSLCLFSAAEGQDTNRGEMKGYCLQRGNSMLAIIAAKLISCEIPGARALLEQALTRLPDASAMDLQTQQPSEAEAITADKTISCL